MINRVSKIVLLFLILGILCLIIVGNIRGYDIEKNGKITIGKYVSQKNYPKTQTNFFIFYINGVKHKYNGGRVPKGFSKNIGKFYKIKYSTKYKGAIEPLIDQEITDTLAILQAGFARKDIR